MSDWECGMMCGDFEEDSFVALCRYCASDLFVGDEVIEYEGDYYCDVECFCHDIGAEKRELTEEDCE